MKWVRSRDEVLAELREQEAALRSSCKSFDEGQEWEAKRLATAVCNVVRDGNKRNRSILTQLGVRGSLRYVSSCRPIDQQGGPIKSGMTMFSISGNTAIEDGKPVLKYHPLLEKSGAEKDLQFPTWWEKEIIIKDVRGGLTRKALTYSLRDQEGGSHFDVELTDATYVRVSREHEATPRVLYFGDVWGKGSTPALGVHLAAMRQIAWELLATLERAAV
jgi:hypothetical protein